MFVHTKLDIRHLIYTLKSKVSFDGALTSYEYLISITISEMSHKKGLYLWDVLNIKTIHIMHANRK